VNRPEQQVTQDATEVAMPSLGDEIDADKEAAAVRRRDEKEIQNDYQDQDGENQGREIEHLILVTHGIGQKLGARSVVFLRLVAILIIAYLRTESVNFIHDVNVLRQSIKNVYSSSADLQALNS
jgi:hypothetical protein